MPLQRGSDSRGKYYRWGGHGKKYYYNNGKTKKKAKRHAIIQGYAIEKNMKGRHKKQKGGGLNDDYYLPYLKYRARVAEYQLQHLNQKN